MISFSSTGGSAYVVEATGEAHGTTLRKTIILHELRMIYTSCMDVMYIKLSGALIIHKAPSKFVPYAFELRFKPLFLCASHF